MYPIRNILHSPMRLRTTNRSSRFTVASFGGKDLVFRGGADRLREHLERAEVPHDVKLYPEAGHSFMSIHRPALRPLGYLPPMFARHHPEAAADAWERVLTFFDRHLSHAPV